MSGQSNNSATQPYIGTKISLIAQSDIRYEGVLYAIDIEESKITLKNVRSFGTENRRKDGPFIAPPPDIYKFIMFRGTDIKEMTVVSESEKTHSAQPNQEPTVQPSQGQTTQPEAQQTQQKEELAGQQRLPQHPAPSRQTAYSDHGAYPVSTQYHQQTAMKPPAGYSSAGADTSSWQKQAPSTQQVQFGTAPLPGPSGPSQYGSYASPFMTPLANFDSMKTPFARPDQAPDQKPPYASRPDSNLTQPTSQVKPSQQDNRQPYFSSQKQAAPPLPQPSASTTAAENTSREKPVTKPVLVRNSASSSVQEKTQPNLPSKLPSATSAQTAPPPESKPKPKSFAAAVGGQSVSSTPHQGASYNARPGARPASGNTSMRKPIANANKSGEAGQFKLEGAHKPAFTEEFDFVSSNSKFKKDEVFGSLRNEKSKSSSSKGEKSTNGDENLPPNGAAYEKDDFFDTISCESLERSKNAGGGRGGFDRASFRARYAEQRRIDVETFGNMTISRNDSNYAGRGRGRGRQDSNYVDRNRQGYANRGRQQGNPAEKEGRQFTPSERGRGSRGGRGGRGGRNSKSG